MQASSCLPPEKSYKECLLLLALPTRETPWASLSRDFIGGQSQRQGWLPTRLPPISYLVTFPPDQADSHMSELLAINHSVNTNYLLEHGPRPQVNKNMFNKQDIPKAQRFSPVDEQVPCISIVHTFIFLPSTTLPSPTLIYHQNVLIFA